MAFLPERDVELALIEQLNKMGYAIETEKVIGPDGSSPERESHSEAILRGRLEQAVEKLNPGLPTQVYKEAVYKVTQSTFPSLIEENRRLHKLLTEGVETEYLGEDGETISARIHLIDFKNPEQNDWLVVSQFVVISGHYSRRPDVVVFVNGLPIAVIELKKPGSDSEKLELAFNQLQTYKSEIPALFHTNALLVTSDGITARVGSLTANLERFMPWRTANGINIAEKGTPELPTLIEGIFEQGRLLAILQNFTMFQGTESGLVKIIAGYHQFHAVNHAVECTVKASLPGGDHKAGVIWHTQGSGKSYLMAFYARQLVRNPSMENPTLVVLTDRNDLDEQLFGTFSKCDKDFFRQTPIRADSREALQKILNCASGGIVFTTIQKFAPDNGASTYPVLTNRSNVVVIADEAHRSQYGFKAKMEDKTGTISYGFAKYLRDALPNASRIGFTGTPIEATDVNTPAVFGNYIDVYDISRAVEDGATVPIHYESRLARIHLNDDEKPIIDQEIEALIEDESLAEQERWKRKGANIEALVGSEKRTHLIAEDLVRHFEDRISALDGKGMIVCLSRSICIKLHDAIVKLRPDWYSKDDAAGVLKIVMTGSASDGPSWQEHIRNKDRNDKLAKRARDPRDPLKLVIVCDMWLTGFDAPCLHTMYVDKPMRGHGLMQAIARVNRVFKDKPGGRVVDYIGIAQNLKAALQQYSKNDQDKTGIDEAQAVAVMMEKYEIVRDMYHGFNYTQALNGSAQERTAMMAGAIDWIISLQQKLAAKENTDEGKKRIHKRYQDSVLALSKAYALASASDGARTIREEVGFFQAIKSALSKNTGVPGSSNTGRAFAIQQIVSRAVFSTDIVDILSAVGIKSPNISIFSEEFLNELAQMDKKNLAFEALRKLLNDGIQSRSKSHIVETKAFTERLEDAVTRYHANAITTAEVLQELIHLAKDVRVAHERGEESGLTEEEVAFYDALAVNKSAADFLGDEQLQLIAQELLKTLRANVSVDWVHRASARAAMRSAVKRILRKYKYPPDQEDSAVHTVIQQAEASLANGSITTHVE